MEDLLQIGMTEDLMEALEGVQAGTKMTLTIDVTVSEIGEDRLVATVDDGGVDPNITMRGEVMEEEESDFEPEEPDSEEEEEDTYEEI
jgi:hypothetical protein